MQVPELTKRSDETGWRNVCGPNSADRDDASGNMPEFPSCMGLAATCGAGSNDNCCQTATVPGGTFNRDNNSSYPATVSTFVLDKYEVTVGRFRAFVNAGMGTQANPPVDGAGTHPHLVA